MESEIEHSRQKIITLDHLCMLSRMIILEFLILALSWLKTLLLMFVLKAKASYNDLNIVYNFLGFSQRVKIV